jgi:gamma-glutamylcyclotransferase (GGCT)/AIG2-like uncharacterized protein YtfP
MYRLLARCSRFVGDGTVMARLYDLGEYPGIVLSGRPDERVAGEVYELKEGSRADVLRILDEYEGLGPEAPLPHEYQRELVKVRLDDGTTLTAWAYVLADSVPRHPRIPDSDYLEWRKRQASA